MVSEALLTGKVLWRFRNYQPQPVTYDLLQRWLRQHPKNTRRSLLRLLDRVTMVPIGDTIASLRNGNDLILKRLSEDGIEIKQVVYVELDSAGSSSGVMLNALRDHENLTRRGAHFVHSKDVALLSELTAKLGSGALIYVDDFSGTGKQFMRNRNHAAPFVVGSFSEFFLTSCICEEAEERIGPSGVVTVASTRHLKTERPLHPDSTLFPQEERDMLRRMCLEIHPHEGLGFGRLATSIAFDRNAPNSTPLLMRGSLHQAPFCGILPRFDDLPIP